MYRRLLAIIGLCLLIALPILTYPLGRDQGEFATIGQGILDGHVPYSELWNPKPPAVFYVYSLFIQIFGVSSVTIRLIDFAVFASLALTLAWIAQQLVNSKVAYLSVILLAGTYFISSFWTLSQNDGIAMLPMALAIATAFKGRDSHWRWAFLSGVMSAIVLWFKYPFVFFIVLLIIGYISLLWGNWQKLWRDALAFAAGGLLIGCGGILYLASLGALDDLIESALVTSRYTTLGYDGTIWQDAIQNQLKDWGWIALFAAIGIIITIKRKDWHIIGGWLLAGIVILFIQGKGYEYHWLPMLPALVLFAALAIDRLLGKYQFILAGAILIYLAFQLWTPAWDYLMGEQTQLEYYSHFRGGEFVADESQQVVDYLKARTTPGESLFIWGFRPEVYYLTELRPATRFIFDFPLIASWYPKEWQQQTVDLLWAALPQYMLVLRGDYMPWVTGRHDAASNELLREFKELENWLIYNYEPVDEVGNFLIWKRK